MLNDTPDTSICVEYPDAPDQCCLCGQFDLPQSSIEFALNTAYGQVCSKCIKRYPDEAAVSAYFDAMLEQAAEEAAWADPENGPDPTDVYVPRDRHTGEEITLDWDN